MPIGESEKAFLRSTGRHHQPIHYVYFLSQVPRQEILRYYYFIEFLIMTAWFALGSNGSGQLGIGHKEDVSVPKQVLFSREPIDAGPESDPVRRVAAGGNHTLIVTDSGALCWSGDTESGACGRVTAEEKSVNPHFRRVRLSDGTAEVGQVPFRVGLAAATWESSIVTRLDEEGKNTKVYTFGSGSKGELGQGEFVVRTPSATQITAFPPEGTQIVDLAACVSHVVAVLSDGSAYGWGNGRKGQLGCPADGVINSPRKIDGVDFKVSRAVCGRQFTVLIGDLDGGEVLFLGTDKGGIESSLPSRSEGWKDIGASWGNVYVLNKDGTLQSWGRNDHGQMAPPNLPTISKMAVGSEHVLALDTEGNALSWGWGEHGNCGPQVDNGDVKGRWNVIVSPRYMPPGVKITNIGAGCATSWVGLHVPK